jgi:V/A-type H+-transporting ATPase subunit D
LAEKENAAYILLQEVEKLKRRINGLEHVIIPRTEGQIKFVKGKLEELALQEKVTMIQIKDKVFAGQ